MGKRLPEIFIVGTMKGGTTILHDYICTHPKVVAGSTKEIHYFSLFPTRGLDWYLEQFPDRPEDTLSIDASPTYFDVATMPTVPAYIKAAAPDSRIILIVRDPVDRAVSHFQHLRLVSHKDMFTGIDASEFFSRPLERCFAPQDASDSLLAQVLDFSLYDDKFTNYARVFGRESILVLTNEELRSAPEKAMRQVFQHCRLDWSASPTFGEQRYLSGSQDLPVAPEARRRLEALLYPRYSRFLRRAGLPDRT